MTSLATARKRRELARSNLANFESTITWKKQIEPSKLDLITLQRLEEQLFKIENGFFQNQELILEKISDISARDAEDIITEEFMEKATEQRNTLQNMKDLREAFKNVMTLQAQVEDWEKVDISGCSDALAEDISRLQNMLERIYKLVTSDAADGYPQLRSSTRDLRFRISSLKKLFTKELDSRTDSDSFGKNTSASRSALSDNKNYSSIKLPSLSLPYFDGGEMEWPSFWERFQSIMAKDKKLTDSDKATYLRSALNSKEAIQIITSQHSVDDYDEMVTALKRRYSNPRRLFRKQVQSLVQFKFSGRSHRTYAAAQGELLSLLSAMERQGQFTQNHLVIALLESNMTEDVFQEWSRFTVGDKDVPSLDKLKHFILNEFDATQGADCPSSKAKLQFQPQNIKKTSKPIFMTNGGRSCSLCDSKEHLTFQCSAFKELSSSERRKRVKGLRLCFNCLSAGHKSESCQSRHSCRTCGQRHHTLIHLSESKETNREMDPINPTPSSLVATNISDEQHALFITCQVLVEGPGGKVKARALIDPGSAVSLATNRLATTVKAEKIKRTTNMSGLQSSPLPGSKYTVSLKLSSVYDSSKTVPLKAALLEGITAELLQRFLE